MSLKLHPLSRDEEFVLCAALRYQFDQSKPDPSALDMIEAWAPHLSQHSVHGFINDLDADRKWGMRRRLPEVIARLAAMERTFRARDDRRAEPTQSRLQPEILLDAVRYACGRTSTAPSIVSEVVESYWTTLSDSFREAIRAVVNLKISEGKAGHDCDVATWKNFLTTVS